jgi:hypothetical protein
MSKIKAHLQASMFLKCYFFIDIIQIKQKYFNETHFMYTHIHTQIYLKQNLVGWFFLKTFLLGYNSCTVEFHSIFVYIVHWLISTSIILPHLLSPLLKAISLFHCSIFIQVYKVYQPYSPSYTLFIHLPPSH